MKRKIPRAFVGFFGAVILPTAAAREPATLPEMLAMVRANAGVSMSTRPLARDWIGDIADEHGKIERMRLEKGRIINGEIALLRTYPNGRHLGSDAPVHVESIPSDEKLRSCSTVAELVELLGTGRPGFSGWEGPEGMHGSHSWICFSAPSENRLTYISVFASTSFTEEERAKGVAQLNTLLIRRGELQPADPNDQKERDMYLSGADMFAAEEAEKARKRERYPQPLRDLVLAREHPDDSDWKLLSETIQRTREAPDPILFAQLVQEMHEGTLRIWLLLNSILLNEHGLLDLKPWGSQQEAVAVEACIESLPLARGIAREYLVETLLRVCGGGKIEVEGANGGQKIEVIPTGDGYRMIIGGVSDPLPLAEAQKELRRLYAESRGGPDGGAQPATRPESN